MKSLKAIVKIVGVITNDGKPPDSVRAEGTVNITPALWQISARGTMLSVWRSKQRLGSSMKEAGFAHRDCTHS